MSPKTATALRIDPDLLAAMRGYKDREGVPVAVQIDRAVRAWLQTKGITVKNTERKRADTRKRS